MIKRMVLSYRAPAVLLAIYWSFLFVINHVPLPPVDYPVGNDKLAHFLAYALLAFLLTWSLFPRRAPSIRGALYVVFCIAAYGALDEYLQRWVEGRTADAADWVANILGGAAGVAAFAVAQRLSDRWRRVGGELHATSLATTAHPSAKTSDRSKVGRRVIRGQH